MRVRGVVIIAVVLAIGLGACGGSSHSTRHTKTSQHTEAQNVTADKAATEAAALKLSDLPSGWTYSAATDTQATDSPDSPTGAQLAKCVGVNLTVFGHGPADFRSPRFSDRKNDKVANTVSYTPSAADAQHQFALFKDAKLPACLGRAVSDSITQATDPTNSIPAGLVPAFSTPIVALLPFPVIGDQTVAYRTTFTATVAGGTVNISNDLVVVVKGRADVEMDFSTVTTPFPIDQELQYLQAVVERLTNT